MNGVPEEVILENVEVTILVLYVNMIVSVV
jgi:hypothetical protein